MGKYVDERAMRDILAKACAKAGSQQAWANSHQLSPAYVSDVLKQRRAVTERIADALGYVQFIGFYKNSTQPPATTPERIRNLKPNAKPVNPKR